MKKIIGIVAAVVAVALAGLGIHLILKNKAANAIDYSQYNLNAIIATEDSYSGIGDHVKGNADAPVLLFEYADFQCPGCSTINPYINEIIEEYGDNLGLVYRNYLLSYHQNGTAAASAAEAAGLQGYWKEYADMLFANQSIWEGASVDERGDMFVDLFRKVTNGQGDTDKFIADMESQAVKKKIKFDMGAGDYIGVPGTPAVYLDGEKIDFSDAGTKEKFQALLREKIDAKLAKAGITVNHAAATDATATTEATAEDAAETSEGAE